MFNLCGNYQSLGLNIVVKYYTTYADRGLKIPVKEVSQELSSYFTDVKSL